jgi:exonuclease III
MRILSWNLWCHNPTQILSLKEVLRKNVDVFCLQEVQPETVEFLRSFTEYQIDVALDYQKKTSTGTKTYHLVIGSKFPMTEIVKIPVEHLTEKSLWDKLLGWEESFEFQSVTIDTGDTKIKLFNIHLECASGPLLRLKQFQHAILNNFKQGSNNIVAGDFNIFAHPAINVFVGWLFGFKRGEYCIHEEKLFQQLFTKHGLYNHFQGQITYPRFNLQLDYILTPETLHVKHAGLLPDLYRSDHRPIYIDI